VLISYLFPRYVCHKVNQPVSRPPYMFLSKLVHQLVRQSVLLLVLYVFISSVEMCISEISAQSRVLKFFLLELVN